MKTTILLFVLLTALKVGAQPKIFTEEALIAAVQKYHPVIRQADINMKIAKAEITTSRAAFDPEWKGGMNQKEFDGINYYNQQINEIRIPTWYGIDIYAGREQINGSRINPEETKGTLNYLGVSMPVIQNLVIDKRRAVLMQAKNFLQLSEVQQQMAVNDLLADALESYWAWWENYHMYHLLKAALQNAKKRAGMVSAAYLLGDRAGIDTLEAFTQVQSFQIQLSEAYTEWMKAQLHLSAFLWTADERLFDLPADVVPQEFTPAEPFTLDALLFAANSNPELEQYSYKLRQLQIERKLKFQLLLPEVTLKYNQIGYDFSKTLSAAPFNNNYRYGVSFSLPLRLSEGRGEYNKAKLKIESTRLEQVTKQVQLYNKVQQYYTEWQQTNKQLQLQHHQVNSVTALQKGEETKFFNGESSLFLINARELKTIEAQQKLIALKAKNKKAAVRLQWITGFFGN